MNGVMCREVCGDMCGGVGYGGYMCSVYKGIGCVEGAVTSNRAIMINRSLEWGYGMCYV